MKLIALKQIKQIAPGASFEVRDRVGKLLVALKKARVADAPVPKPEPVVPPVPSVAVTPEPVAPVESVEIPADDAVTIVPDPDAEPTAEATPYTRRTYRRRDLRAEP